MSRLNLIDSNFLIAESRQTPMHVGGLHLYRFPRGANRREFLDHLYETLASSADLRPPFNQHLAQDLLSRTGLTFRWEVDDRLDLDYHVRHSALPSPGRYRELFALASRLHSTLLDRSRPLWEIHLIEGLQGNEFALYFKIHHSAVDGVAAMHLTQSMLSKSARSRVDYSPLSCEAWQKYRRKMPAQPQEDCISRTDVLALAERLGEQLGSGRNVARALLRYATTWAGRGGPLSVPWRQVPHGTISSQVSGSRRFVAQSWPHERVRAVAKGLGGTLNDAVLAMCAGALRGYLAQSGDLPDQPLKAMVPISLRVTGDLESANAVGFIIASLATDVDDPAERFETIRQSMLAGKAVYHGLSPGEASLFTQLTMSPLLLTNLLGVGHHLPAYNLVISNVPGPRQKMYWNGARLLGLYPASVVLHGQAMNITLVSYGDQLDFGITACRRTLPHVQRLLDHLEQSLQELEAAAGLA